MYFTLRREDLQASGEPVGGRLERLGRFFNAGEVRSARNYTVLPTFETKKPTEIEAMLDLQGLKPLQVKPEEDADFLTTTMLSARSRGAQVGLMALAQDPHLITPGFCEGQVDIFEPFRRNGLLYFQVSLVNAGKRALIIKEGDSFASMYSEIGAHKLEGEELARNMGDVVTIGGECGKHWCYVNEKGDLLDGTQVKNATALALEISSRRLKVTPGPPIHVFDEGIRDYRGYLEKNGILVPIEDGEQQDFWIGETTAPIEIEPDYNGLLTMIKVGAGYTMQTLSFHIKGGETSMWPIRVEVVAQDGMMDVAENFDEERLVSINYKKDSVYVLMDVYRDK